ncbi:MAG: SPOR domain-containing protein [Pseudomonadota bacterium]
MTSTIDDFDENFDDIDDFDDEDRGVSGFVVLLIILAMLLAFSFIVWLAYNKGIRQGTAARDVPYVAADPEPVKRTVTAGGETVTTEPNREVYDRIDGRTPARTEVLASAPEQPITLDDEDPIAAIAAQAIEDTNGEDIGDAAARGAKTLAGAGASIADKAASATGAVRDKVVGAAPATNGVRFETADGKTLTTVIEEATAPAASVTVPPAPSRGVTPVTKTTATRPAATGSSARSPSSSAQPQGQTRRAGTPVGTHVVQVGAFRSQAEADQFWGRLGQRFGGYIDGKSKDIERADLGAKGIYYRLRVAGFDSSDAAGTFCNGLKARNQDCLVKAR